MSTLNCTENGTKMLRGILKSLILKFICRQAPSPSRLRLSGTGGPTKLYTPLSRKKVILNWRKLKIHLETTNFSSIILTKPIAKDIFDKSRLLAFCLLWFLKCLLSLPRSGQTT